jgi:hypothetical protein
MLPSQFIFALPTGNASTLATSQNATNSITLNVTTVLSSAAYVQRRVVINSLGADLGLAFNIAGFNAAGMKISELLPAVSTGNATSILDYASLISPITVQNLTSGVGTATSSSITVGITPIGCSLWQSVNNMVTPMNLELSGVPVPAAGTTVTNSATWSMQYTYDDPNFINPVIAGATTTFQPQPFTHATLNGTNVALDGSVNDPIFAWRLQITAGTGTVRATGIQAGIAGP